MADQITSVIQNPDGSYSFGFIFDNGAGATGNTWVFLPPPQGTSAVLDDNGTVITPAVAAIPYNLITAKAAVLQIAAAQKSTWISQLGQTQITGNVTI